MTNSKFETLKKEFEKRQNNNSNVLYSLAEIICYSVLKSIRGKITIATEKSNKKTISNGNISRLNEVKKDIYTGGEKLKYLYNDSQNAILKINKNGRMCSEILNKNIEIAAKRVYNPVKTDELINIDIINECIVLLLQEKQKAIAEKRLKSGWLDTEYITEGYNDQIVIGNKKPVVKVTNLSPIRRIFRGLRNYIAAQGTITQNSFQYAYVSIYDDNFGDYFKRIQKYSSIVINDEYGSTASISDYDTVNEIIKNLKLSAREKSILDMLFCGYTENKIAKRLGISANTIKSTKRRIQKKAIEYGLTP